MRRRTLLAAAGDALPATPAARLPTPPFPVVDTLYGLDNDYVPRPQMLGGHTVEPDGLLWTLRLRDGLRFHDGTPVLARDCVASIRRWASVDGFGATLMDATAEL